MRTLLAKEPEADGSVRVVEELAGEGDRPAHDFSLNKGAADVAFAGLVREHAAIGEVLADGVQAGHASPKHVGGLPAILFEGKLRTSCLLIPGCGALARARFGHPMFPAGRSELVKPNRNGGEAQGNRRDRGFNDNAGEPAALRIDRWALRPNASKPEKGKIQLKGEFNDGMRIVTGGGIRFDYAEGTIIDLLDSFGFTRGRGAKYKYRDLTRKGVFLHRIGGSSRSKFSFRSKGDVAALLGISPINISMASDGFLDEVSVKPRTSGIGSNFSIGKNAYRDPELYVDTLMVKRFPPARPNKDSIRLTLRFPGGSPFRPETDTLVLSLGFFEITVEPNEWTPNRAGTKIVHSSLDALPSKVTIKVNQAKRTLSLTGKKLMLPGPDAATPETSIGLGFGDFVKVNAVNLQVKVTGSGAEIFR